MFGVVTVFKRATVANLKKKNRDGKIFLCLLSK